LNKLFALKVKNEIIIVGDKVLIEPSLEEGRTDTGLYLPQGVREKDRVSTGKVIKVGPGYPVPDPSNFDQEPWTKNSGDKYFPLQAKIGDDCIFLKDQAVEITFESKKYIVIPHSAILVLTRD
jgi:chaperonin GroES